MDSPKANVPAVFVSYMIPPHEHPDTPALAMLNTLLIDGESSRLHKRLVKDDEAAFGVFGWTDGRTGPGLFRVIAAANAGAEISDCERLMYEEIERVKTDGVGDEELNKLKVNFKTGFISGRQTVLNKAEAIHHYVFYHEDISEINSDMDAYMAVTADDIQRVAKKYLREDNRTAVTAMPPSS